jgi:hypothetical protein
MNFIASLKHTHKHHEHIVFWRPNQRGYTPVLATAGHYTDEEAATLNDGWHCIAVPQEVVDVLSVPTPHYKPGHRFYDEPGPVVSNTRANWNVILRQSLTVGRKEPKPKPEVFRGKRRCIESGVAA